MSYVHIIFDQIDWIDCDMMDNKSVTKAIEKCKPDKKVFFKFSSYSLTFTINQYIAVSSDYVDFGNWKMRPNLLLSSKDMQMKLLRMQKQLQLNEKLILF